MKFTTFAALVATVSAQAPRGCDAPGCKACQVSTSKVTGEVEDRKCDSQNTMEYCEFITKFTNREYAKQMDVILTCEAIGGKSIEDMVMTGWARQNVKMSVAKAITELADGPQKCDCADDEFCKTNNFWQIGTCDSCSGMTSIDACGTALLPDFYVGNQNCVMKCVFKIGQEDFETTELADGPQPCDCTDDEFCNNDDGLMLGSCESCSGRTSYDTCNNDGLPALGAADCLDKCVFSKLGNDFETTELAGRPQKCDCADDEFCKTNTWDQIGWCTSCSGMTSYDACGKKISRRDFAGGYTNCIQKCVWKADQNEFKREKFLAFI